MRDALAIEHAEDIVVGLNEERGWVRKWRVQGEPANLGVAVRADDGQILDFGIKRSGSLKGFFFGRKQTIFVKQHGCYFTP